MFGCNVIPDEVTDGSGSDQSCEFYAEICIRRGAEEFQFQIGGSLVGDSGPGGVGINGIEFYDGGYVEIKGSDCEEGVDISLQCTILDERRWSWSVVRRLAAHWWRLLYRGILGPFA